MKGGSEKISRRAVGYRLRSLKSKKIALTLSGKIGIIPDTRSAGNMPQDDARQIVARIYGSGRGNVFTPKDFIGLVNYENVQKTLARLAKQGTIRRLMRGVYEYPAHSKLLNAPASPDPGAIARAIARAHGWTILPSSATALNLLGLSTQVPATWEYFSDGPSKTYKWHIGGDDDDDDGDDDDNAGAKTSAGTGGSGGTLVFKPRANKEITKLSSKTALIVQALKALGEKNVTRSTIFQLRKRLSVAERKRAAREARYATSWVYEIIKKLAQENGID
jgi:hypothetical protein